MIVLALLFLAAAQAPADAPPADAPPADAPPADATGTGATAALVDVGAFADGMAYYDRFEFEKASFRFRATTRATELPVAERARAHLWLGLALAQGGDEIGARQEFVAALTLDEQAALPADAPPSIHAIFEDARAQPRNLVEPDAKGAAGSGSGGADAPGLRLVGGGRADAGPPVLTLVGGGLVGAGALALAGGAVLGVVALSQAEAAQAKQFQDEAIAAHEEALLTAGIANALLVTGATAAVVGAAVVVGAALFGE